MLGKTYSTVQCCTSSTVQDFGSHGVPRIVQPIHRNDLPPRPMHAIPPPFHCRERSCPSRHGRRLTAAIAERALFEFSGWGRSWRASSAGALYLHMYGGVDCLYALFSFSSFFRTGRAVCRLALVVSIKHVQHRRVERSCCISR